MVVATFKQIGKPPSEMVVRGIDTSFGLTLLPCLLIAHLVLLPRSNPYKSSELQSTTIYRIPDFCLNKHQHQAKTKVPSPSRTPWNRCTAAGTDFIIEAMRRGGDPKRRSLPRLRFFNWHYSLCSRRAGYLGLWPPVWQQKHGRLEEELLIGSRSFISKLN
jgi:hypothetical protein